MTDIDIKELRRLAEAALLPGGDTPDANRQLVGNTDAFSAWVKANGEYHQAANPSVVLALLDRLEQGAGEVVAWRYREIGAPFWEFRDDRAPHRPNNYEVQPLYAAPVPDAMNQPHCQKCGGVVEGWICQGCGQDFEENDEGNLVFMAPDAPQAGVVVPLEPTEAMHKAGLDITERRLAPSWTALNVYRAMIAAAPPAAPRGWRAIAEHDNSADEVLVIVPDRATPIVAYRHHPSSRTDTWFSVPGKWQVKPTHFAALPVAPGGSGDE